VTRHALSGGRHYDPANTSFGPLLVHDEHRLAPAAGFPEHPHRDVVVVTVVLQGVLRSSDSTGRTCELRPGSVLRLRAGDGVRHEEVAGEEPVVFVQAHVLDPGGACSAEVLQADVVEAGPARLHLLRAPAVLPAAPRWHLCVATGDARVLGADLSAGDSVRLTGEGPVAVEPAGEALVLAWELP
jgi:quercetin 2,3-dioxygenase